MTTFHDVDDLWEQGYRPFEIYVCNEELVEYCGEQCAPGEVAGWEIKFVLAKRDELASYPFFDAVILGSDLAAVEYIWMNGERISLKEESK